MAGHVEPKDKFANVNIGPFVHHSDHFNIFFGNDTADANFNSLALLL